jgi:hypothetical protein
MLVVGIKQIERTLDLSWNTIRKLHYTEGLPLHRLGNQWALDIAEFREWLSKESQCVGALHES